MTANSLPPLEPDPASSGAGIKGTATPSREDNLWGDLLMLIEAGEVVPIVGRELLRVGSPPADVHLYEQLARRVADKLDVAFAANEATGDPLNTVACRYLGQNDDPRPIYMNVFAEATGMAGGQVPDSLLKLAAIDPFKLFLTTIFDDSLRDAINQVRFNGLPRTDVRAFAPKKTRDLPGPFQDLSQPVVFHLLGHMSPTDDYVVTEEDALEFVHWLQKSPPVTLFSELYEKDLLVLGCRFPSWLVRSFIRLSRPDRLRQARGRTVFVVDTGAREDQKLIEFLRTFKTRTEVFERAAPIDFVTDLHARWRARRQAPAAAPAAESLPSSGAIFISYASEDRQVAEAVATLLKNAKLDAWFDRDQLMAGDQFKERIQKGIRRSDLFLPILSRNCLSRRERYFRWEWDYAMEKARGLPASVKFIFPVVIDDVPPGHEDIPAALSDLSWMSIAGGLTTELVSAVKERYRRNQGD